MFNRIGKYWGRGISATLVVVFLLLLNLLISAPIFAATVQVTKINTDIKMAGSVSGLVFEDLNFNNQLDLGEKKLNNWKVGLYQEQKLIKETSTNFEGRYYFNDLQPGQYEIKVNTSDTTWVATNNPKESFSISDAETLKLNFPYYQTVRVEKNIQPMVLLHNTQIENLSPTSIRIIWFSTHYSTSQVVYEKTNTNSNLALIDSSLGYRETSAVNFNNVTYHSVTLNNLQPNTQYDYRVTSLANPKQWRGSSLIFSEELSFITLLSTINNSSSNTNNLNEEGQIVDKESENNNLVLGDKKDSINNTPSIADIDSNTNSEVTSQVGEEGEKESAISTDEKKDDEQAGPAVLNCQPYIWILLILNLILSAVLRSKGKRTKNKVAKKIWSTILILVLVPTILGYPQCWLNTWLIIVLVIGLVLLGGFKKKKNQPEEISSTPDEKHIPKNAENINNPINSNSNIDDNNSAVEHYQSLKPIDVMPGKINEGEKDSTQNSSTEFFK